MAAEQSIVTSVTIGAPPEEVWKVVSDTTRYAEWVEATTAVTRSDGPGVVGATYDEQNVVFGPVHGSSKWTVVEADPPRRAVHRGEGIFLAKDLHLTMELVPAGEGTEFTQTLRYRPAFGPIGALINALGARRSVERGQQQSMRNLARLVESEATVPADAQAASAP
jgi:uncharacterized protein YndB with AHSA1/START domain